MLAVVESQVSFRVPLQRGLRYTKCNLYLNEECKTTTTISARQQVLLGKITHQK